MFSSRVPLNASPRATARSTPGVLISATLVALTSLCALVGLTIVDSYREAWHQAAIVSDNVALLLERDIARNIELFDLSLQTVVDNLADADLTAAATAPHQRLFDHTSRARDFGGVVVLSRSGDILVESTPSPSRDAPRIGNFVDREYFKHSRDAPPGSNDLYIGHPFQSRRHNGTWTLPLTRRVNDKDGNFAGIVLGGLRIAYLEKLFRQVSVGQDGVIYLLSEDGTRIASMPPATPAGDEMNVAALIGASKTAPSRRFVATTMADRIDRLTSYHRVGDLPLVVGVGLSVDAFLAGWWHKTLIIGGALAVLIGVVVFLVARFSLELKRRAQAERALSNMATTDDLTGMPNRRKFDMMLDLEWRRAERDATLFSLLMIDVDFFKSYNDSYGHQDGDRTLRNVAHCIAGQLERPGDFAARYGGEEFAVLLPQTDAAGARAIAESIRAAVHALDHAHAASVFDVVTVSIGVATVKPRYLDHPSVLVRTADQALYRAKSQGRNSLFFAGDEDLPLTA